MESEERKETDDVSGAARAAAESATQADESELGEDGAVDIAADDELDELDSEDLGVEPAAKAEPPPAAADLAEACVRFVVSRYGIRLDYQPETLSVLDQWVRDARTELRKRGSSEPDADGLVELVQSTAGAYLGEVIRRTFGANWRLEGSHAEWRLMMSTVFCAYNPVGMAREALFLGEEEGWHAHFELDPAEKDIIEARLAALPEVGEDEYYALSTRFDVVNIVVDALRERMRASGFGDVRFSAEDYEKA